MAEFNLEQATFAALCFVAGKDNKISSDELKEINKVVDDLGYFSLNKSDKDYIYGLWESNLKNGDAFLKLVTDSLAPCSKLDQMKAFKHISLFLNRISKGLISSLTHASVKRADRWPAANELLSKLTFTPEEYDEYITEVIE